MNKEKAIIDILINKTMSGNITWHVTASNEIYTFYESNCRKYFFADYGIFDRTLRIDLGAEFGYLYIKSRKLWKTIEYSLKCGTSFRREQQLDKVYDFLKEKNDN